MQPHIPDTLAADAAFIAARVAEFERREGKIKTSPIRIGDPKTPDSWRAYRNTTAAPDEKKPAPPPAISLAQKIYMAQCADKRKEITPAIIEMSARRVKVEDQAKKLGVSPGLVLRIRDDEGLSVKRKPRKTP